MVIFINISMVTYGRLSAMNFFISWSSSSLLECIRPCKSFIVFEKANLLIYLINDRKHAIMTSILFQVAIKSALQHENILKVYGVYLVGLELVVWQEGLEERGSELTPTVGHHWVAVTVALRQRC